MMTTSLISTPPTQARADEVAEAREDLAARLERLAQRVRAGQGHTGDALHILEAAYIDVVKLNYRLQPVLGTRPV